MYVVVQIYPWFEFYFPLLLGMLMYDNEFETMDIILFSIVLGYFNMIISLKQWI